MSDAVAVYDLFKRGSELLEAGDFMAATIPLERAALAGARQELDPRGARPGLLPLGPLRARRAEEFAAVVERYPVNDYAHFCLGRSLEKTGRTARPRRHAALAARHAPGSRGLPGAAEREQQACCAHA